jgi:hypothetical protein
MSRIHIETYGKPENTSIPYLECRQDGYEDWDEVQGWDAEDAVSRFAEHIFNNRDGWEFMPKNCIKIEVKDGDKIRTFSVSTDFDPSFHSTEIE